MCFAFFVEISARRSGQLPTSIKARTCTPAERASRVEIIAAFEHGDDPPAGMFGGDLRSL